MWQYSKLWILVWWNIKAESLKTYQGKGEKYKRKKHIGSEIIRMLQKFVILGPAIEADSEEQNCAFAELKCKG